MTLIGFYACCRMTLAMCNNEGGCQVSQIRCLRKWRWPCIDDHSGPPPPLPHRNTHTQPDPLPDVGVGAGGGWDPLRRTPPPSSPSCPPLLSPSPQATVGAARRGLAEILSAVEFLDHQSVQALLRFTPNAFPIETTCPRRSPMRRHRVSDGGLEELTSGSVGREMREGRSVAVVSAGGGGVF